ncbi:hypothetical protein LguiA_028447 [Lonicera macranthoides]
MERRPNILRRFVYVLNRDMDNHNVLLALSIASTLDGLIYGELTVKDLALELVENGMAKYVEWSELDGRECQEAPEVIEVVSGDCIFVADDSIPFGSPLAERRVNLSSIRCMFKWNILRKVGLADGPTAATWSADSRVMDFGSVFFDSQVKDGEVALPAWLAEGTQPPGFNASAKKARGFLPFLQQNRRMPAVVEYMCWSRRALLCSIALMRRKIMQRDVEIEVETVDRTGTFLGSLWESKTTTLLEAGLAKFQIPFGIDRIADADLLVRAEQSAKRQKLMVVVTEVLGGGKFYVQTVGDQKVASILQQLASLNLKEAPIVNAPRVAVESPKDKFEGFYIDYGNQKVVAYSQLRPLEPSASSVPGLAHLCSLAYVKVPSLEEDYGQEAAVGLSKHTLNGPKEFRAVIEERDSSGGKVKGQGTRTILMVTLVDAETDTSINATMLQVQNLHLSVMRADMHTDTIKVRRRTSEIGKKGVRWEGKGRERQQALDDLEKYQSKRKKRG